jgi:hypothetical protein
VSNIISDIEGVVNVADSVIAELGKIISSINISDIDQFFSIVNNGPNKNSSYSTSILSQGIETFDRDLGRLIVQPLIEGTMGVNYNTLSEDSSGAVATLEGAVGFSLVLDGITSGLDAVLKTLLGDRAPEFILDTIRKIPQAVGMEYFLGITLANTFEKAVGTPLEEAINIQVLPSRLDLQTIRQLLKAHKMSDADADTYRQKLGFNETDWSMFIAMGESLLPIGDLQSAYEYGLMTEDAIVTYLESQGYSDSDITLMTALYLHNSETSGGQIYREVARTAYLANAITSDNFKSILATAGVPANSITMELEALDLQKSIGLKTLSASDIKYLYDQNDITAAEVQTRLKDIGYVDADITLLMKEWDIGNILSGPKASAKTIVRYYRSGIITQAAAEQYLGQLNIRQQDIDAILASPNNLGSGYAHKESPSTIISAFKDGLLTSDQAMTQLESIAVEPDEAANLINTAIYAGIHKRVPKAQGKLLDVAQIEAAVKYGIAEDSWAIRMLQQIGYSTDDAETLAATYVAEDTGAPPTGWVILS